MFPMVSRSLPCPVTCLQGGEIQIGVAGRKLRSRCYGTKYEIFPAGEVGSLLAILRPKLFLLSRYAYR